MKSTLVGTDTKYNLENDMVRSTIDKKDEFVPIYKQENDVITHERKNGVETVSIHELEAHADTKTITSGRELLRASNQFQRMSVIENKWWGRILYLDNVVNVAEHDEFIYHEMLIHVPMMAHPNPKRVLIVGGGDGGSAREVMKHDGVE
jgi:spermidine synthase